MEYFDVALHFFFFLWQIRFMLTAFIFIFITPNQNDQYLGLF